MIRKTEKLVITFSTTTDTMAMEKLCKARQTEGRIIPVPGSFSADCALAWCEVYHDYYDNAATTLRKPPCVVQAVTDALCNLGNPGRSIHEGAMDVSRIVFEAREALAQLKEQIPAAAIIGYVTE